MNAEELENLIFLKTHMLNNMNKQMYGCYLRLMLFDLYVSGILESSYTGMVCKFATIRDEKMTVMSLYGFKSPQLPFDYFHTSHPLNI